MESILTANLELARKLYKEINQQGYFIYVVREFKKLPPFVKGLKEKRPSEHTGFFVSSKITTNQLLKISNNQVKGSFIKANEAYKWYMKDAIKLESAASEFLCQGLELEWPIVCFGGDYFLKDGFWQI
ncbi:DNA/RNA helicase domain-containing protein [Vagococcus vulneris]|uniref:Schlafen group 3-like DNA/RNA helicase domain-containing protein n=1 Tax=Vagococcus vulneris TaxID=1977869 RepID=A0A430A0X8_9ENTE|nr:hypothetical protein CBF37_01620 [Vagococcus vulneris]